MKSDISKTKKEKTVAEKTAEAITAPKKAQTVENKSAVAKTTEKPKAKTALPRVPQEPTAERKKRSKVQALIAQKARPTFRGRFGKPNVRRKSIEKWQKWRKPRGIDIRKGTHRGRIPNSGYQTVRKIRGLHPSGFEETLVASIKELRQVQRGMAIRIRAGVGKQKRRELVQEALQKGFKVLN